MTPAAAALAAYLGALRSDPKLPFHLWAERNVANGDGTPFKFRPYQILPAADMFNPEVASIALRQYSGAGKTLLFSIGYAYGITQLQLAFGKMFPAEYLSADWLRKKLMPIMRETGAVKAVPMVADNSLLKIWENGATVEGVGSNSGGRIRTLEIDVADADEIDAIEQTVSDEGDKLAIFLRRTRGRPRQHHWLASYPSVKGQSKIDARVEISDNCRWLYDCPECGEAQAFDTPNIKYPQGKPERAVMECPECSGTFGDRERLESCEATGHWQNRDGEVVEPGDLPSDDYGRRRGLTLNCTAHVGAHADKFRDYLHEIAAGIEAWKASENPEKARREFENTMRAQSFEQKYAETADAGELEEGRTDPEGEELPGDVVAIYCGMDVNKHFLAVQVIGWGENEVYPLHYEEIRGSWERPSTWAALGKVMRKTWLHPSGVRLRIRQACWDSKFQPDHVYKNARKYGRRVVCIKGSPTKGAPPLGTIQKKDGARVMTVGSSELKALVYDWLSPEIDTKTSVVFSNYIDADGYEMFGAEYFAGLTAEDRSEEMHAGRLVPVFFHDKVIRNEPLDTFGYAIAAAKIDKFNHKARAADIERRSEKAKAATDAPAKKRTKKKRANFGGFKL